MEKFTFSLGNINGNSNFDLEYDMRHTKNNLANMVLQALKNTVLNDEDICLRIQISTNFFLLFEHEQHTNTGNLIFKILVLMLVEWHED